jgi:hypothetical protein
MMSRIVFSLMLARTIAPGGRGNIFGFGLPVSGSAGSWEATAVLVAPLLPLGDVAVCAPANAPHKMLIPAQMAIRDNTLPRQFHSLFIVVVFLEVVPFSPQAFYAVRPPSFARLSSTPVCKSYANVGAYFRSFHAFSSYFQRENLSLT